MTEPRKFRLEAPLHPQRTKFRSASKSKRKVRNRALTERDNQAAARGWTDRA